MINSKLTLTIKHQGDIPKYQQVVNAINDAIGEDKLGIGDVLPSVNSVCKDYNLSRDTVFKAYSILKEQNVIVSVPNKGYYVSSETKKILLVLDTFKAYKEVLYHSITNNLSSNYITDIQFHHYNIDAFKTIINNSIGKYSKYVVMNFNNDEIPSLLKQISNDKLLLIDWDIHSSKENNFIFQDFGTAFYDNLNEIKPKLETYNELVFLYPKYTNHPIETVNYFKIFCVENNMKFKVVSDSNNFQIEKNCAYISVSDRMLGKFLEQCADNDFELGKDVGVLSYNETPMKKFINKGISVISTDFKKMGNTIANFITSDNQIKEYIETNITLRKSL